MHDGSDDAHEDAEAGPTTDDVDEAPPAVNSAAAEASPTASPDTTDDAADLDAVQRDDVSGMPDDAAEGSAKTADVLTGAASDADPQHADVEPVDAAPEAAATDVPATDVPANVVPVNDTMSDVEADPAVAESVDDTAESKAVEEAARP